MPVYVDDERLPFRGVLMCHMIADSLDELHDMAGRIGMKRAWFQPLSFPHYDISLAMREVAIGLGAVAIDRRATALKMRELRPVLFGDAAVVAELRAALAADDPRHAMLDRDVYRDRA